MHAQMLADRDLFHGALQRLLSHLGIKLKMPKVGGSEVDLHLLYKEVTHLGGLEVVTQRKQWVLVCEPFQFPTSFTNRSFVMKKLYVNALHHFEQVRACGARHAMHACMGQRMGYYQGITLGACAQQIGRAHV